MLKSLNILLSLLFVSTIASYSYGQTPTGEYDNQSKRYKDHLSLAADARPISHAGQTSYDEPNAEEKLYKWLIGLFDVRITDVLLALFTLVLAIKTKGLFDETHSIREIADHQRGDFLRSIKAAEAAAMAAKKSADVAESTLVDLERPYIFVFGVDRFLGSWVGTNFNTIQYVVANYGRTPAVIDLLNADFCIGDFPEEFPGRIVDASHTLVASPILAPQDVRGNLIYRINRNRWIEFGFTTTPLLAHTPPKHKLFFRVRITYSGPFNKGMETSAAWEYAPHTGEFVLMRDEKYTYRR